MVLRELEVGGGEKIVWWLPPRQDFPFFCLDNLKARFLIPKKKETALELIWCVVFIKKILQSENRTESSLQNLNLTLLKPLPK